ncbi:poly-beta-1,6-N-acetyl-D-glucosamine biosynthesis protein PgaD [Chromohalobacter nigrandesensis]|uniref:poly-beta-1,6-N-acetyl-D-glucosamine biosynthesis protein PgaD n=1 Tax=Chromohalobacter nigrandesensis TaxID=119863 RepID=UPI001FF339FD|nr:poly-beta-1,6-N-acetyl-D-glucosamine biosynthesis protein PgaD [Chromohalobacter nigrandesensis]MCK0746688.1 poly-beta-1,6-N-acetyl-D-glucosamine biosynthesis protein PgaD [Chromohalobacter nigrandesensis]
MDDNADTHSALKLPNIIYRPDLQSRRQRGLFALLAGVGWLIWLYLFLPLSTLLGWAFGSERFQAYVIDGHEHSWSSLMIYAVTVVLAGAALLIWAFYNYRRFRHADRRRPPSPLTTERLATSFGVDEAQVARLQQGRVATLYHDAEGNITDIEVMSTPSP